MKTGYSFKAVYIERPTNDSYVMLKRRSNNSALTAYAKLCIGAEE